ncbi:MAG: hypothetical protein REI96_11155 [Flavobacterium nitrogenifigens]|uniref:hypothetical protein n=1 Tax=Flavobacterium nitrogenifigens TaxID=1617283 RepID=UPI002809A87C|nr:hypothetical protein [Flavobacterium nitrogenifigens]MDQ8012998.1 hypothetical protein [Flavobacterium nitrogenifigens]
MKIHLFLLAILPFMICCTKPEKIDLSELKLDEPLVRVIHFNDSLFVGVETVEYPFCLFAEVEKSQEYTFEGIDLSKQKIMFQINSEKLKTDSISRFGGAHIDLKLVKNENELVGTLRNFDAEDKIYGVRIAIEDPSLKLDILKKIELKYGKGTKNPNTDNGLYWNVKKENKYIFFAPDYDRLIILNSTNLSKTCYWDIFNGLLDFGGCDNEKYMKELVKNSTKPEDVRNKPVVKIDKNWNLNNLVTGKSTEDDFLKSPTSKNFERIEEINGSSGEINQIVYQDEYHDFYFYFAANPKSPESKKTNSIKCYSLNDLKKVEISFENGLTAGMKFEDAIKLLDKKTIAKTIKNEGELSFANYIIIKNGLYEVSLVFDENLLFSGMFVK